MNKLTSYTVTIACPIDNARIDVEMNPLDGVVDWDASCECGDHPLVDHDRYCEWITDLATRAEKVA